MAGVAATVFIEDGDEVARVPRRSEREPIVELHEQHVGWMLAAKIVPSICKREAPKLLDFRACERREADPC